MKKLSLITFILLFSVSAFSQFLNFGIKAGVETSTAPEYDVSKTPFIDAINRNIWNSVTAVENSSWGFHGGIFTRINISWLYIQPEVVFTSTSFEYARGIKDWSSDLYYPQGTTTQTFNRLSIPILVGMKLGSFRINAGPAVAIQLGTPKVLVDYSGYLGLTTVPNFDDMYKEAVWGFQAGLGIDIFKKLTFDVRYAGSLGEKFGDTITLFGGPQSIKFDHNQKSFLVSLGFMF